MPYRAARPALSTFCLQSSRRLPFRLLFLSFLPFLERTYLYILYYIHVYNKTEQTSVCSEDYYSYNDE